MERNYEQVYSKSATSRSFSNSNKERAHIYKRNSKEVGYFFYEHRYT